MKKKFLFLALITLIVHLTCAGPELPSGGSNNEPLLTDLGTAIIPTITFIDPAPNQPITTPYTMIISIDDDKGVTNAIIIFKGVTNTLSNTISNIYIYNIQSLPNGQHSAMVVAVDSDGNTATNGMTVQVANPAGTPSVTWEVPQDNSWTPTGTIFGSYAVYQGSLAPSNAIRILTNGTLAGYATTNSSNWQYDLDLSPFSDGSTLELTAIAVSDKDIEATNTINIRVDNSPPILTNISPTNNQTVSNTGFTITGETYDNHSGIRYTSIILSNWQIDTTASNFSIIFDGVLYGGSYELILLSTNKAGLVSTVTNTIIVNYIPYSEITNFTSNTIFTNTSIQFSGIASIEGGYKMTNLALKISNASQSFVSNQALNSASVLWSQTVDISALDDGVFYAYPIVFATNGTSGTDNNAILQPVCYYKDTTNPTNYINTNTVFTNGRNFLYGIDGNSYDGGSGIDRVVIVLSNVNGISTNYVFGGGINSLNWNKEVNIAAGTNRITVQTFDRSGKSSTALQKMVIGMRSIVIDGVNDFDSYNEKFTTTSSSSGYYTYITWNLQYLYLGFEGPDIADNSGNRWVLIYISTNTNEAQGNIMGVQYDVQKPYLPFTAHYHLGIQLTNTGATINEHYGTDWVNSGWYNEVGNLYCNGTYYEVRIPLSDLGNPSNLWLVSYMLEEHSGTWSYAKLYNDNLPDGADTHLTKYLEVDVGDIDNPPNSVGFKRNGDFIPPTVTINWPTNGLVTTNTNITVSGTASDLGSFVSNVYLELDGGGYSLVNGTTNWSTNLMLSVSNHSINVFSLDSRGNSSSTNSVSFTVTPGTYHTIVIDGTKDFYNVTELFDANSSKNVYFTWDANKLYFGMESEDMISWNKAFYVVISTNTNVGTNQVIYQEWYTGSTVNLPFKAQFVFYFKGTNTSTPERLKAIHNGTIWISSNASADADMEVVTGSSYSEMSLLRSSIGDPSNIWLTMYFKDLGGGSYPGWGWFFGACPDDTSGLDDANDGEGDKTVTKWIQVTLTSGLVPNDANHIKP